MKNKLKDRILKLNIDIFNITKSTEMTNEIVDLVADFCKEVYC